VATVSKPASPVVDYHHSGRYDHAAFEKAFLSGFKHVPKFNAPSVPSLMSLLGKIGDDPRITDVRWTAYILATSFVESSQTVVKKTVTKDKRGRSHDHRSKVWRNFEPIEEKGHGRQFKYARPVKVKRLPDGNVSIIEYDGERWTISATTGHARSQGRHQKAGTAPDAS